MLQTRSLLSFALVLCGSVLAVAETLPQRPTEPEGTFVAVNGRRLWYRAEGQGKPLLLIPGGPGVSHTYLWPHFSALTNEFQVVYFDALGRGKSDRAASVSEYNFQRDVDEIESLRMALGLGKIAIYGQSYGGMVAQAYALRYPGSLTHLILGNTLHSAEMWQGCNDAWNLQLENQMPELWATLRELRKQGHLSCDAEYQRLQDSVPAGLAYFYDPSNADRPDYGSLQINLDVYCQLAGPDADIVLGGELASLDFQPRLKDIAVPTLILAGRFDRVALPRFAVEFQHLMPQARFVMFEKSGHWPFIEEPEKCFDIVRTFLRQ